MKNQLFFGLCLALILGILTNDYFKIYTHELWWVGSILLLFSLCSLWFKPLKKYFLVFVLLHFFLLGLVLNHKTQYANPFEKGIPKHSVFRFELENVLNSSTKNRRYTIKVQHPTHDFKSILLIPKSELRLDYEHTYTSSVYLIALKPSSVKNLKSFDYAHYLARDGVFVMAFSNAKNIKTEKNTHPSWVQKTKQWRLDLIEKINLAPMDLASREFLKSIILADRTTIEKNIISNFTKTGLVHLLAISGSHILLIFWIFQFLLGFVFHQHKATNIILSLIFIGLFSGFIGFGNSVVRSCLMLTFYYSSLILERKPNTLHSLSLAALLILFFQPNQIFDLGFQLSFLAVLGIYWLYTPIKSRLWKAENWFLVLLANTLALTLAAQLATFPILIYLFGNYSLLSIVYNLIMVPLTQIIIIISFLESLLIGIHLNFEFMDIFYNVVSLGYLKMIQFLAQIEFLYFNHLKTTLLNTLGLYILVYYIRFLILKPSLKKYLHFVAILCVYGIVFMLERQFFLH